MTYYHLNPTLASGVRLLEAVLEGGPETIPTGQRTCRVPATAVKISIPYHGGYEHFERLPQATSPLVFRWTTRTWAHC